MANSRIAAVDVGNDAVKANFGKLENEMYIPNVVAQDMADRPVIGIEDLDEKEEAKILQKLIKQRKDSAKIYKEQNRTDLFEKEKVEIEVIQEFLPEQMNEAEIREEVQKIISQTQASSIKDMGKVMGMANKALAGKAEGRVISSIVKELLST